MDNRLARMATAVLLILATDSLVRGDQADDQFRVASGHYSASRWQLASDEFLQFLEHHPQHVHATKARFLAAEALVQLNRFEEARTHYESVLSSDRGNDYHRQSLFRCGEIAYLTERLDDGQRILTKFSERYPQDPKNAFALTYLGQIAMERRDAVNAQRWFSESLKQFPEGKLFVDARFGLAQADQLAGNTDRAAEHYAEAARLKEHWLADDARFQIAMIRYNSSQFEQAIRELDMFQSDFPNSEILPYSFYWQAMALRAQEKWLDAAQVLDQLAQSSPDHRLSAAIVYYAAESWRKAGEIEKARNGWEQVHRKWPSSQWADDSLEGRISLLLNAGDAEQLDFLVGQFEDQYFDSPLLGRVRQMHVRSLLTRSQFDEAIQLLQQQLSDSKDQSEGDLNTTRYLLSLAFLGQKESALALEQLSDIEIESVPVGLRRGMLVARANGLIGLERYEEAIVPLADYLDGDPAGEDAASCRVDLALAMARLQRWDEASRVLDDHRRLHPDDDPSEMIVQLADIALAKGQRAWAERLYDRLAGEDRWPEISARGLFGLAWTLWDAGQWEDSAEAFQHVIDTHPESDRAAEAAVMRGRSFEKLENFTEALKSYQWVGQHYEDSQHAGDALLGTARVHSKLHQFSEAEKELSRLIADRPESPLLDKALYQRAWVLIDVNRDDEAKEDFAEIYRHHPKSAYWCDATYRLAELLAKGKKLAESAEVLQRLEEGECKDDIKQHALYLQGQVAMFASRWEDVPQPLERLLQQYPDSALRLQSEFWIAESFYQRDVYDDASERFDVLAQQLSELSEPWTAVIPLRQAQLLAVGRQWPEAYDKALEVREKYPDYRQMYEVNFLLGRCLASQASFQSAREAYGQVIGSPVGGKSETAAMAQWMIGESYLHQQRYEEAIRAYLRVEILYDFPHWQAAGLLQAGKCYEIQGSRSEAVRLYARLLNEYPDSTYAVEASKLLREAVDHSSVSAEG